MSWTDEEIDAEVLRQKASAEASVEFEAHLQEHNSDSRPACKEWIWSGGRLGDEYYWAHICGQQYYQLDCPEACYLRCEGEE